MAKDPAVLWYWNDWHGGTCTLSRFLKGAYMDLLHAQFNSGNLSLEEIKTVLGSDFGSAWPTLQKKFKQDDNGLFFNERLVTESVKRKSYSKSRRDNLKGNPHMAPHMEIEIENVNEIYLSFFKDKEFEETWKDFGEMRKKIKAPTTAKGEKLILKKLDKISLGKTEDAILILEQSIENSWKGVFPLKTEYNGTIKKPITGNSDGSVSAFGKH